MRSDPETRAGLDGLTAEIELTLISIIQGVALSFLAEHARFALSFSAVSAWLYVAAGLLVILIFWSRSVLHTLTLIRWPLEFVHNFLYVTCALGEAILFTRLDSPRAWFTLSAGFTVVIWFLFVVDLRIIAARCRDSRGEAGAQLCAAVRRDQWFNIIWIIPGLFLLNLICCAAVWLRPDLFLNRGGHGFLIAAVVCALMVYLVYVVRLYNRLAPLVSAMRSEWYSA
ncbi:MAG: hypothetical protein ACJ8KU_01530 [Chthoniobacterales bacterium]